jgi:hypothetical protein
MIILPLPRISNAGGFLDSDAIDVEHMQQRRFVAIDIGAYLTKGFLVQMERYLERGVVTPEADAALRRIVISAYVRKMEGHQCSHDAAQPAALFAALSAEITGRFTGMLALAGPELPETPVRLELVRGVIALDPVIDEANFRRECFRAPCQPPGLQEPVHVQVDMESAVLSANGLHRREIGRSVRRPIRNSVRHGE